MKEFSRQTTCGELIVFIEEDNGKYKIKTLNILYLLNNYDILSNSEKSP